MGLLRTLCDAFDVGEHREADSSHGLVVYGNRKHRFRPLAHRLTDELTTGPPCIGMRKPVPQVEPDIAVVRVHDERFDIVGTPRSNSAIGKGELHK